jgi:hypothetical protein
MRQWITSHELYLENSVVNPLVFCTGIGMPMVEQWSIESIVADFALNQWLPDEKIDFLVSVFRRLVKEGDFTRSLGAPPEWIQEHVGAWEYKNCTWGHCVCNVLVAVSVSTEDDPLEAPFEFLDAESIWSEEEVEAAYRQEFEEWSSLTQHERLKRYRNFIRALKRP